MKTHFDHEKLDVYKAMLERIVSMLVGPIRSTSTSRVYEESSEYVAGHAE